jgi:type II secretory pathway pseudopilin PulG
MRAMARRRPEGGFSFIEILVVMGIITLLTSMVVVIIPIIREKSNQTKSRSNVSNILVMLNDINSNPNAWPPYNGKNFTLAPFAHGVANPEAPGTIDGFFSPGDAYLKKERLVDAVARYKEITKAKLKAGAEDFSELTSYAGRMNGGGPSMVLTTADTSRKGTICLCDDDTGPVHHPAGLVVGFSNGMADFMDWEALEMPEPKNVREPDPFLGENAPCDLLRPMSSR